MRGSAVLASGRRAGNPFATVSLPFVGRLIESGPDRRWRPKLCIQPRL